MSQDLRDRCSRFLASPPPAGLGYIGDSIAERILTLYAQGTPLDEELGELLEIAVMESQATAETLGGAAGDYLLASAGLLQEIAEKT